MRTSLMFMFALSALLCLSVQAAPPDLAVLPAEVRGVVLFPDGETPVVHGASHGRG